MQMLSWTAVGLAGIASLALLWWLFDRVCTHLEEAGYMYYREKPTGSGGGSVLGEIDKLVRPSIEHTIELRETTHVEEDGIDGE